MIGVVGMKKLMRYPVDPSLGHGFVESMQVTENFSISHIQATYHKDQVYHASGAGVTRFHFRTSGAASMEFDGVKKIEESGPVCQVLHHPRGMGDVECIKAGIPVSWVTLGLDEDFLESQLGSDFKQLPELLRSVQKNTDQFMIRDMPLQPEMRRHLIDIENLQHEGGYEASIWRLKLFNWYVIWSVFLGLMTTVIYLFVFEKGIRMRWRKLVGYWRLNLSRRRRLSNWRFV